MIIFDISTYQGDLWLDHLHHWVPSMEEALGQYRDLGFHTLDLGDQPAGYRQGVCFLGMFCVELFAVQDWVSLRNYSAPMAQRVEPLLSTGGGVSRIFLGVPDMDAALSVLARGNLPAPTVTQFDSGEWGLWTLALLEREEPVQVSLCQCSLSPAKRAAKLERMGIQEPAYRLGDLVLRHPDEAGRAAWFAARTGLSAEQLGDGSYRLPVPGGGLRLIPGDERVLGLTWSQGIRPEGHIGGLFVGRLPGLG